MSKKPYEGLELRRIRYVCIKCSWTGRQPLASNPHDEFGIWPCPRCGSLYGKYA